MGQVKLVFGHDGRERQQHVKQTNKAGKVLSRLTLLLHSKAKISDTAEGDKWTMRSIKLSKGTAIFLHLVSSKSESCWRVGVGLGEDFF